MKNILITGAARGIGYYLVKQLLFDGYCVTVLDIDTSNLASLEAMHDGKLIPLQGDVGNLADMERAAAACVQHFGSIDCAIHNACRCSFDSFGKTAEETFRAVFAVNFFGALHLVRVVTPYMKKQGGGKVIFTSSGVGVTGFVNISPYASSKGAIESFAKCLNIEYRSDHISFHIFHPPLTETESSAPLPVPKEFMAAPEAVGTGLAKHIGSRSFIICHSFGQKLQTMACYLFPVRMGRMMSMMTGRYMASLEKSQGSRRA